MKRPKFSESTERTLASGPIVWFGIIVTTCLLLVVFQTMLWLVLPVMLAIIANYILSPLVDMAMARGMTRHRAVIIVTILLCIFLLAVGVIAQPKVSMLINSGPEKLKEYAKTGEDLVEKARESLARTFPFLHSKDAHDAAPDGNAVLAPADLSAAPGKPVNKVEPVVVPGGTIAPFAVAENGGTTTGETPAG